MEYVSLNIKGKAEYWYECYVSGHGESVITWEKFCVDICQRFGAESMDVMRKFNSVEQSGDMDVEKYLERFEEAMSAMISAYPGLQETFYLSCFISGLKPDIKAYRGYEKPYHHS
uniref:Putative ovule protein n=1 Tax=Solanum chacoense TaxID=4108 RepID=A0A0V0HI96_SOLCH